VALNATEGAASEPVLRGWGILAAVLMRRRRWSSCCTDRRHRWSLVAALLILSAARPARADGAFPDSLQILLPADRPNVIGLATNFGVILSEDTGRTWQWVCEVEALQYATLYQVGPPPLNRFFAVSIHGVVSSDDLACSWNVAGGLFSGSVGRDVFPDPSNPEHVLAIALPIDGQGVFESINGGVTFDRVVHQAGPQETVVGVEIAASDPRTLYVTGYLGPGVRPQLIRTYDGEATWETVDLQPVLGSSFVRIIAVDPGKPRRIYLRNQAASYEELAISDDGGTTLVMPVRIMGQLGGFALLPSGTIVVGGVANIGNTKTGAAFRSRDGGLTFEPWPKQPRVRALAQRGGVLFVAGDNYNDGFALATSTDEGTTLTPILRYEDVSAVKPCAHAACGAACDYEVSITLWPASVCDAGVAAGGDSGVTDAGRTDTGQTDAGQTEAGSPPDAGTASDAGGSDRPGVPPGGGCGCATGGLDVGHPAWVIAAFALASRRLRRRGARKR